MKFNLLLLSLFITCTFTLDIFGGITDLGKKVFGLARSFATGYDTIGFVPNNLRDNNSQLRYNDDEITERSLESLEDQFYVNRRGYGKPLGLRNWGSGCTEGTMFCDYQSGGFWTCAQSRYVYRACGPGTKCQQQGQNNLFCNYA